VALSEAISELLARSDELDYRLLERELAAELRGYRRGHDDGWTEGYRQGRQDEDRQWFASLAPARAAARILARTPTFDELDKIRYPPGGRKSWLKKPEAGDAA